MRYLETEQLLGTIFYCLLKENIYEMNLNDLNDLIEKINRALRKENETILNISSKEIFITIERYNDFFYMNNNIIMLQKDLLNIFKRTETIKKIDDYFVLGIPNDIKTTLKETIKLYVMEKKGNKT